MNSVIAATMRVTKLTQLVLSQCRQIHLNATPGFRKVRTLQRPSSNCLFCTSTTRKSSPEDESDESKANLNETEPVKTPQSSSSLRQSVSEKYIEFQDRTRTIQDVIEEAWDPVHPQVDPQRQRIVYERGITGVFDLEELTELLREERAFDLCVVKIPKEMDYADHMVIVTALSPRHMFALATFVRRRFKNKRLKSTDVLPRIEGTEKNEDWVALDLGNIILHIFTQETRDLMDLETLWTVGSQYDDISHRKDTEVVQLLNLFQ